MSKRALSRRIAFAGGVLICAIAGRAHGQFFYSTGHNIPIPDNDPSGAILDIVVSQPPPISHIVLDLNVGLIITHTWQGDLIVTLEHVGYGAPVTLIDRPGFPQSTFGYMGDNFGNLAAGYYFELDDEAAGVYDRPPAGIGPNNTTGIANVTGHWQPDGGLLSAFDFQPFLGTWRLRVVDTVATDSGAIHSFALFGVIPTPSAVSILAFAAVFGRTRRRSTD